MDVIARAGREDIAFVYVARTDRGKLIEFVESVQPPLPRQKKWVLIVSTLYGCPVGCRFCDAGGFYMGRLSKKDVFDQLDYLVKRRFPDGRVPVEKFKIQFARMGEPALNPSILEVLEELPRTYDAPGLVVSLSTVAPVKTERFFEELLEIKSKHYRGRFQLQFSIHTTDAALRDWLVPVGKWDFARMAEYGREFLREDARKIALNFALAENMRVDPGILLEHFSPDQFVIKITPVNPTHQAMANKISSHIVPGKDSYDVITELKQAGYDVILSIGELEENLIGSNCGQFISYFLKTRAAVEGSYTYPLEPDLREAGDTRSFLAGR